MNISDLLPIILSYGAWGMFCIALLEKMIPIVPSYILLIFLGMVAASSSTFFITTLATISGSLAGSIFWYCLGRFLGEKRVKITIEKYGKYIFLTSTTYENLANSYRNNRFLVTMIGQVVPIARIYLALPAGILKLPILLFLFATLIGIFFYNLLFLTIGAFLKGSSHDPITIGVWTLCILLTVEVSFLIVIRLIRTKKREL
ncbi:VTT domain-containing protein [Acinetobacter seifertii]|uniref:VTT domain-containing protein n=1 Tax=Acinetobacter seifertii TaxID=1530123 RepID=A0A7H2PXI6_9GAMM|nr:VTT domain-containing protein [Acinetobacter seifertii]QNY16065.1 VTT domain-containing protein [Acinetobacter seifertii]